MSDQQEQEEEQRGLPNEFEFVFAVDVYGDAKAVQMPEGWRDFMVNGSDLDENGFDGHKDLPPGLYSAHAKGWSSTDWETGIVDDMGFDLSDIKPIWTPTKGEGQKI